MWQRWPYVVTVHTAGEGVDEYGNTIPSAWTSATARGDYQPVTVDETRDAGGVETDEVRFYFPTGTSVGKDDRLELADGTVFEVIGDPDRRDTGSALDYVRARARRTA